MDRTFFGPLLIVLTLGGVGGVAIAFKHKKAVHQELDGHPLSFLSRADHGVWVTD